MLRSLPALVGTAALAVAAVGATVTQAGPGVTASASSGFGAASQNAPAIAGATIGGSSQATLGTAEASPVKVELERSQRETALEGRERAVSRDSQRQALEDAAEAELQQAAESQARERNAALAALAASAERYANEIAANTWQNPLPAGSYDESASFGQCSALWANCHTGQDLSAPSGTPIFAVTSGTITEAGYDGSYGNKTVLTVDDGTEIWFAHQTSFTVAPGDVVRPGQVIGYVGSTGNSTGPHLHLEVHPGAGDAVDPIDALSVRGVHLF